MEKPHGLYRSLLTAPRLVRLAVGILLIIGGIFSILPVLGLWMIPLGVLVIFFERPWMRRQWLKGRTKWKDWRHRRAEK